MKNTKLTALVASSVAVLATANADMLAGWDFSQYSGPGFNTLSNPAALPFTETLTSNYSDLDPNGVGIESTVFGTLHYDGSFGSTDVNPDGGTDEILPTSGSLLSNSSAGNAQFALANANVSLGEGAQNNALDLSFTSQAAVDIVFAVDLSSVGGAEDYSLSFAGLGVTSIDVSFSTDGVNYGVAETFNLTAADQAFTTSTYNVTSNTGFFLFEFAGAGGEIDNVSIGGNVVPEPSTYAAIFGAVALAFAASRRRK